MQRSSTTELITWGILLLVGLGLRGSFAEHQAFTNDEGAYLYDARVLLGGRLPGGDVLTKTPVTMLFFMVGEWITQYSLYAARTVTVVASLATAWPLFIIGRELGGRHVGMLASSLWLLGSGPIIFHSLGQTEAIASLLTSATLAVGLTSKANSARRKILLVGVLFLLAFASRKTSLAVLVPLVVVWLWPATRADWKHYWPYWGAGAALILIPWLGWMWSLYGVVGIEQALGLAYGRLGWGQAVRDSAVISWGAPIEWVITTLGRIAASYGWLVVIGLLAAIVVLVRNLRRNDVASSHIFLVPITWLFTLLLLYASWPTVLPEYSADFFPAAVLVGAVTMHRVWQYHRPVAVALLGGWLVLNTWSLVEVHRRPWFGMFTAQAIHDMAHELRQQVPADEPIFTAAVIVPYISGHQVWHDVAHPHWYRYQFIKEEVLTAFMPSREAMEKTLQDQAQWALVEHLTDYVYLRSDADLITHITRQWQSVAIVPNHTGFRDNPLQLWHKR